MALCALIVSDPIQTSSYDLNTRKDGNRKDISFTADELLIDSNAKLITLSGKVNIELGDFRIDCTRMLINYTEMTSDNGTEIGSDVSKIIALGNVIITRTTGEKATSERAEYLKNEEKIILTDNPVIESGSSTIEGCNIIIHLTTNSVEVLGCDGKPTRGTIYQDNS